MADISHESAEDDRTHSIQVTGQVFKTGNTTEDVIGIYDQWVKDDHYQKDTNPSFYKAHIYACEDIESFFPGDRSKVKVIDIGAGTGRVSEVLLGKGFRLMDALEPSEGMLEKARKLNVYQRIINECISDKRLPIQNDYYDLAIVSGAMGEGHIPVVALHEMARIVRPGGVLSIAMREEFVTSCAEYKDRLEPLMKKMESDGVWKMQRKVKPNYYLDKSGLVYRFVIC
ncbi:demethylmenaquinone methyltransferase-like [Gigantopelta aegis]|uniref:demethylmenaquinone methyltransferase-like n=1 Tax=Gigantopelta aegis TaxID=1735272 RepID=UPI001B88E00A|nr:demethylmenaquinone methyltransferase-like [Gigantopelta aegis]